MASAFSFSFNLAYPVDSGCKLKISFPVEMPITSDLTTVSGESLFSGTNTFKTKDIASNYLELDGCPTYSDVGSTALISLSKIVNIGYIKDTSPFILELYSVVGSVSYKIA